MRDADLAFLFSFRGKSIASTCLPANQYESCTHQCERLGLARSSRSEPRKILGESEMDELDATYQNAVDQEVDRLARLSPCELMQLKAERWKLTIELGMVELAHQIFDDGNLRRIAVVAERPLLLGFGKRKFAGALN
jgi:hypothetical protein